MLTAIFNPASLALVLMLRFVKDAARSSTMMASTVGTAGVRSAECGVRNEVAGVPDFNSAEAFIIVRGICAAKGAESMRFPYVWLCFFLILIILVILRGVSR